MEPHDDDVRGRVPSDPVAPPPPDAVAADHLPDDRMLPAAEAFAALRESAGAASALRRASATAGAGGWAPTEVEHVAVGSNPDAARTFAELAAARPRTAHRTGAGALAPPTATGSPGAAGTGTGGPDGAATGGADGAAPAPVPAGTVFLPSDDASAPPVPGPRAPMEPPLGDPLGHPLGAPSAPATPSFSADGRWWWDGSRWQEVAVAERPTSASGRRRRPSVRTVLVVAAVVVVVGVVAGAVRSVATGAGRTDPARGGLSGLAAAQDAHRSTTGAYASSVDELVRDSTWYAPDGVVVEVLRAGDDGFCASASSRGRVTLYVTEAGEVSRDACA
ncbi:hypothetical protein [Cellulomonas carbonis]|uniref:DUF2510 domain-containing protein n=1 Tax=Cellulomonas carbonis T26 TaxID=947969 RepID=A0A0A0BSJ4_9CELL|nr:hypothetical protein [Cellulomonas carbonis]KGM10114.1 hypothetical protein N868_16665 [Cellulomonas carbonis T26]GGB94145.1 hypothetical protein GCM10010972_03530 [Cellulomonas carbonis]